MVILVYASLLIFLGPVLRHLTARVKIMNVANSFVASCQVASLEMSTRLEPLRQHVT